MFEVVENTASGTVIKVIGVGGAGGNAVDHMIRNGVAGGRVVTPQTEGQGLSRPQGQRQDQFGVKGPRPRGKPPTRGAPAPQGPRGIPPAPGGGAPGPPPPRG